MQDKYKHKTKAIVYGGRNPDYGQGITQNISIIAYFRFTFKIRKQKNIPL